jgi:hypothetical protein
MIFLKNPMAWTDDTNVILLEVIDATDPHNSNYGEKSENWKEVIKAVKEIILKDLKLIAPLNEDSVSRHLESLLHECKARHGVLRISQLFIEGESTADRNRSKRDLSLGRKYKTYLV